jgi:hypothetical protein
MVTTIINNLINKRNEPHLCQKSHDAGTWVAGLGSQRVEWQLPRDPPHQRAITSVD